MNAITEQEALNRMAAYCSTAEHCRAEVYDKLKKWGLPNDVMERVIKQLETEKYIDEDRYCRSFVNDKFCFAKWGKVKIAQALYLKKIPSNVSWRYLDGIDNTEYIALLNDLLQSKRKSVRAKDDYELNNKLIRFAMSRGFEIKDIKQCLTFDEEIEYPE